ncbi:hypothetical protein J4409_02795 [Candidatus Woesearchaeota archaeon]|nr:hypothetical protein [Candidatus Woesearchaeota archaeon]
MKLKHFIITLFILTALLASILSVSAYFRDDYWECTSQGEASQGDAYGRRIGEICGSDCCILCVSPNVFQDCLGSEARPICMCGSGNPNDFQPPEITILSPLAMAYSVDDILINVQTNEKSTIKRKIDNEDIRTMCTGCTSAQYLKSNIAQGQHKLFIEATDQNNNKANKTVYFTVDSLPPVIKSTKPADGSYVNNTFNEFSVDYDENNVVSVMLNYKSSSESSYRQVALGGCPSGLSKSCETLVNLNEFAEGTELDYYFSVSDASSTVNSAVSQIIVDNSKALLPFIINYPVDNAIYGTKNIPFDLSTSDLSSFYYSTDGIRFNRLCSNCKTYTKNVTSIRDGIYDLLIRKIDANGNHDRYVHIMKDTTKPKIKKIEPDNNDDVSNGLFSVIYTESYAKEVSLSYGPLGNENIVTKTDCPSGKYVTCEFSDIDLSPYNGQPIMYSFAVSDYVRTINSKVYTLNIDTVAPELTVNNPINNGLYDNSIIYNIQVSEPVTLEISDNGGKFSRLCSNCVSYLQKKSYTLGNHNLIIKATDPAGNADQEAIGVVIF